MAYTAKSYSKVQTATSSRTVVEDNKKKTSLLKDNSWIKKNVDEDEKVEVDSNFGRTALSRYKSKENIESPTGTTTKAESKTTTVTTSGSTVQALSKRFGGSQDALNETRTTTTRSVRTQPRSSITSTTTVKDGAKITETVTTTRRASSNKLESDLSSSKSAVTTVKSSKDIIDGPTSTVKTTTSTKTYTSGDVSPTKTTSYSSRSTKSTDDQLFDTLIPTSVKATNSDYKSEVITVKSSKDTLVGPTSSVKTTTRTYTSGDVSPTKTTSYSSRSIKSTDDQFDTLIPTSVKASNSDYKSEVTTVKSSKDTLVGPTSSVKTTTRTYTSGDVSPTKTTSYSSRSIKSTDDQLFDTLIPTSVKASNSDYKSEVINVKSSKDTLVGPSSSVKTTTSTKTYTSGDVSPTKSTSYSVQTTKSDYKPEVTTVNSLIDLSDGPTSSVKTTTSVRSYSTEDLSPVKTTSYSLKSAKSTEDLLFDTLIPTSMKTTYTGSTTSREDQDFTVSKSIRTVYSSSSDRHDWDSTRSITSPSYTSRTSYTDIRPSDYLSDTVTSKSSTTVYTSPERRVTEKDLCTYCRKNMYTDEKIILEEMNINCHSSCFKCEVCNTSLGHLKAGDNLWVYRSAVHCESCFNVTKGKWHR
ncbi:sciellin isoform X1 [Paramisgurnus dabryanus]|uniref:sciellin isoform X1 n=1 Tax=Paramisgurnus dabryanus TaxID=90735 RepID=UPI0031F36CB1